MNTFSTPKKYEVRFFSGSKTRTYDVKANSLEQAKEVALEFAKAQNLNPARGSWKAREVSS